MSRILGMNRRGGSVSRLARSEHHNSLRVESAVDRRFVLVWFLKPPASTCRTSRRVERARQDRELLRPASASRKHAQGIDFESVMTASAIVVPLSLDTTPGDPFDYGYWHVRVFSGSLYGSRSVCGQPRPKQGHCASPCLRTFLHSTRSRLAEYHQASPWMPSR